MQSIRNLVATAATAIVAAGTILTPAAKANEITSATGEVSVINLNTSEERLVGVGDILKSGDILRPAANARVTVSCNDRTIWIVPPGIPSGLSNGCPQSSAKGLRNEKKWMYPAAGGTNPDIPFTISPRRSSLLETNPLLQWNVVADASLYLVQIEEGNKTVWQMEVSDSSVVYPDDAPPLQPGVSYRFTVEADTGAFSQDDSSESSGFKILNQTDAAQVQAAIAQIEASTINDELKGLLIAEIYKENLIFYQAILTLEDLVTAGSQNPLVYQRLGELYANKLGLNLLAEQWYERGMELAANSQNRHILANCQAGLAGVKLRLGKLAEAEPLWQNAIAEYQALGDPGSAEMLEQTIADLIKEI